MTDDRRRTPAVIAVSACSTPADYVRSLEQVGAAVRMVGADLVPVEQALADVDGVVLTGGADIDPVHYGEVRHPTLNDAEPGRDEYEAAILQQALARDLPVLAICRGAQMLNVALGGTLIQDIPSEVTPLVNHDDRAPSAHDVTLSAGTILAHTLSSSAGTVSCRVNSRHHQSIKRLGTGLIVSAVASDGVIEAVEKPDASFCVGVQWHPENFWRTGEFRPLFEAFLRACEERRGDMSPEGGSPKSPD